MDDESRQPEDQFPIPINSSGGRPITWDCFDCITISDEQYIDVKDRGETADKYWADGWMLNIGHMSRCDFDVDSNGRYHRVYPTRYFVENVEITKSMRRVLAQNADLRSVTRPLRITPAKEKLYIEHHFSRFGSLPSEPLNKRYQYIVHHPATLLETCFFLENELIAFSIFEVGDYSIWSNLGVWSPAHAERSLGIMTVLSEMEYARKHRAYIYYMGHFFPSNSAYQYKLRFRPMDLYDWDNECWIPFENPRATEMLREPLRRRGD
jgi:Putative arginyl-tRNA:protein arginylyltransferase